MRYNLLRCPVNVPTRMLNDLPNLRIIAEIVGHLSQDNFTFQATSACASTLMK